MKNTTKQCKNENKNITCFSLYLHCFVVFFFIDKLHVHFILTVFCDMFFYIPHCILTCFNTTICYVYIQYHFPLASFTKKTDRHHVTEILLKVALNTIKQTNKSIFNNAIEDLFLFF
jgi:hypothetical protein